MSLIHLIIAHHSKGKINITKTLSSLISNYAIEKPNQEKIVINELDTSNNNPSFKRLNCVFKSIMKIMLIAMPIPSIFIQL